MLTENNGIATFKALSQGLSFKLIVAAGIPKAILFYLTNLKEDPVEYLDL